MTVRFNEFTAAGQQCGQGYSQAQPDSAGDLYLKSCSVLLLITSCYALAWARKYLRGSYKVDLKLSLNCLLVPAEKG